MTFNAFFWHSFYVSFYYRIIYSIIYWRQPLCIDILCTFSHYHLHIFSEVRKHPIKFHFFLRGSIIVIAFNSVTAGRSNFIASEDIADSSSVSEIGAFSSASFWLSYPHSSLCSLYIWQFLMLNNYYITLPSHIHISAYCKQSFCQLHLYDKFIPNKSYTLSWTLFYQ